MKRHENKLINRKMNRQQISGIRIVLVLLVVLLAAPVSVYAASANQTGQQTNDQNIRLKFTDSVKELTAGQTYRFQVNTAQKVNWSAGNSKIASVNKKGLVSAKRYGKTRIYAGVGDQKISVLLQVKGKKIVGIDPGHQSRGDSSTEPNGPGSTVYKAKVSGGTCGISTRKPEYKLTLEIALKLKQELWNRGYQVVMTRTKNDVRISNKERALFINESGADIGIRIHADGITNSSVRGASVLCPSSSNRYISRLHKKSKKLSECIISSYCNATGLRNRGISYRDDLTGTNWSKVPVTLIELGFMTNSTEDRYMASSAGQKKMVRGIAEGIDSYFAK